MSRKTNTVRVTLTRTHTHRGERKQPGDTLQVTPTIAQWLEDQGVIAPPKHQAHTQTTQQEAN